MSEFNLSAGFYSPDALAIVGGSGTTLVDSDGKQYIDCVGGHGVANLGHANPKISAAVTAAWENFAFATARHPHPVREKFLAKLSEKMPFEKSKIFLSNSGTEAVEAALKIVRLATGKQKILAAKRSFHGRTMGALSATWKPEFREPFEPLVSGFDFFAFNKVDSLAEKMDALRQAQDDSSGIAAVILESIQGEGGVYVADPEFFAGVRKLCDKFGALLIIDEVQSGVCRTGKFLALENFAAQPDIICMAKSLAGGYPIGATAFRADLFADKKIGGMHASTFGGSVPACAAGLAVLDFCDEENLCERAAEQGEFLKKELEAIDSPKIKEVRGLGLMLAIEFKIPAKEVVQKLQAEGVLVLPTGPRTIRLLPPLVITQEQIMEVVKKLGEVLG
jgi:acetylornithine/LysW-gamma-L-lysine aminotransferase